MFPTRPHCPHSISTPIPARTRGSGEGRCTVPPVPCAGGHLRSHGRVRPPGPAPPRPPTRRGRCPTFTNWWRPSSAEAPDRTPAIHASPIGDLAVCRPARIESRGAMLPSVQVRWIAFFGRVVVGRGSLAGSSGSTTGAPHPTKEIIDPLGLGLGSMGVTGWGVMGLARGHLNSGGRARRALCLRLDPSLGAGPVDPSRVFGGD